MAKFNAELKLWETAESSHPHPLDKYFSEILFEILDETPDRIIQIQHEGNEPLTCGQLKESSIAIAQNLTNFGIKQDDIVVIICKNSNFVTSLIQGTVLMGAVVFPLSHLLSPEDFATLMGKAEPKMIVCDEEAVSAVHKALNPEWATLICVTSNEKISGTLSAFELLKPLETEFVHPKFDKAPCDKMLAILCSSATTGQPKGVIKYHLDSSVLKKVSQRPPSVSFLYSKVFWASGFFLHLYSGFFTNDLRIWTNKAFSIDNFIEIVEKYEVTSTNLLPSVIKTLMNSEKFLASNHASLMSITGIGSSMSEDLRQAFKKTFPGKQLYTFYGSTECSVSFTKPDECFKTTSVGSLIFSNRRIKIVDDDENYLGPNEVGEIRIKTKSRFPGYFKDPEATASALDHEGFFKIGDMGYFDENGALYIIDRKKDTFVHNNSTVFPSEIEKVIAEIDGIEIACVVGIYDPEKDTDLATAAVKLLSGVRIPEAFIIDYVAQRLPTVQQLLGGVHFLNEIPLTDNGKIKRGAVKDIISKIISEK